MRIRSWLAALAGLVPPLLLGTGGPALQVADAAWISSVAVSTGVSSATVPTPSLSESPYYPVPQLSTANVTIKQVSCVNRSFCMGVGFVNKNFNAGVAEIWNGSSWSIQGVPDTSILMGVSCVNRSFCMGVGGNDQDNGTMSSWTPAAGWQTDLVGGQEVTTSVSCPATNWCWAVGRSYPASAAQGYYGTVAFWGGSPADGNAIGNIQQLTGISCPTTSWCFAVGNTTYNGSSYYDQGTTWGAYATWTPVGGTAPAALRAPPTGRGTGSPPPTGQCRPSATRCSPGTPSATAPGGCARRVTEGFVRNSTATRRSPGASTPRFPARRTSATTSRPATGGSSPAPASVTVGHIPGIASPEREPVTSRATTTTKCRYQLCQFASGDPRRYLQASIATLALNSGLYLFLLAGAGVSFAPRCPKLR